jgi:hypothetical protein
MLRVRHATASASLSQRLTIIWGAHVLAICAHRSVHVISQLHALLVVPFAMKREFVIHCTFLFYIFSILRHARLHQKQCSCDFCSVEDCWHWPTNVQATRPTSAQLYNVQSANGGNDKSEGTISKVIAAKEKRGYRSAWGCRSCRGDGRG